MRGPARALRPFFAELAASARLRWGVRFILGLLLGYAILLQTERLAAVRHDHHAELERLKKAETLVEQQTAFELLDAERENHRKISSMFWQAETEGLAQAKLQAALAQLFGNFGLTNIHFRSGSGQPVPDLPGIWRIQVRMDTNYRPGLELRIFHALATHPKKLVVDRLDLKRHSKNEAYLVLIVSSYFVGVATQEASSLSDFGVVFS